MSYDWIHYYKTAYEQEKRRNTVLAGKVADSEAKKEFLQDKLQRIEGNVCFKMLKPLKLTKKVFRKMAMLGSSVGTVEPVGFEEEKQKLKKDYAQRLDKQADSYKQWILEEEDAAFEKVRASYPNRNVKVIVVPYELTAGITTIQELNHKEAALQMKTGVETEADADASTVILFAENPEYLDERAVEIIERYFTQQPNLTLMYGSEDQICAETENACGNVSNSTKRINPWFKPCWSEDTLFGFFYFGSYFAVRMNIAKEVSWCGSNHYKENLYDFCLKVCGVYKEKNCGTREKLNCDLILYHERGMQKGIESTADREYFLHTGETVAEMHPEYWGFEKEYTLLKRHYLESLGIESESYQTAHPEVWTVVPKLQAATEPLVSVVIPSKDHPEVLKTCISSFIEKTKYKNVEFIIVDNGSSDENKAKTEAMLAELGSNKTSEVSENEKKYTIYEHQYLYRTMEFNFSVMCNLGAKAAKGEYILLLNDDIEIIEENWLTIMVGQAMLPGTGAVGAKLWYPQEERIQHTGITNMQIGPSHKLVTFPDDRTYYYGRNTLPNDMIAVTAACLLIKKEIYDKVGGLEETMKVAYNDVDFCFKVYEQGFRNVIRNDAVLLHHESLSRGLDEATPEKWQRLLEEKTNLYNRHPALKGEDPYYSKMLVGNAPDYRIAYLHPFERPLQCFKPEQKAGKSFLEKHLENRIMLTVERALPRNKIHLEEPDIYFIEGWCYMLNAENSQFDRQLVLETEDDNYYLVPLHEKNRPDVKAILPLQMDIELSGFTCRILKEGLINATYTVGILYQNRISRKYYYQRSSVAFTVE